MTASFFIRTSKVLMRLNDFLQPQNVLIVFVFSMKHSYLLTAEITYSVWTGQPQNVLNWLFNFQPPYS